MNKVIETLLTTTTARSTDIAKNMAASQNAFTPWEGTE
jgi:hypothetical protein